MFKCHVILYLLHFQGRFVKYSYNRRTISHHTLYVTVEHTAITNRNDLKNVPTP